VLFRSQQVIGEETAQAIFEFSEPFNQLNLTPKELGLLFPLVFTMPGKYTNDSFKEPELIQKLHEYYTKAIVYEMNANKRDKVFLNKLSKVLSLFPKLNLLQQRNIRAISPQLE